MPAWKRFVSFWMYPVLAAGLVRTAGGAGLEYLWLVPAGLLLWTLLEYGLHRFVFHWTPRNVTLGRIVGRFHTTHHDRPRDPDLILARPKMTLPVSAIVFAGLWAAIGSASTATGLIVGVWAGFLYYEWVHYRVHTSGATWGLASHRRRHFFHHFVDGTACFGVTSPLWDRVFGTYGKVPVESRR